MYVLMLKYQSMPQSEIPSCTRWFPRKSWRSSMQRFSSPRHYRHDSALRSTM